MLVTTESHRMTRDFSRYTLYVAVAVLSMGQSRPPQPPPSPAVKLQTGETPVVGECLTKEELDLNRALRELARATRGVEAGENADDPPRLNPTYFVGKWTIEGTLPESPLGPAGEVAGVETVRHIDGCTYESIGQIKAPAGSYTVKTVMVYDRERGYLVRVEQDSRGFQLLKTGGTGGDAGGYFSHYWSAPSFAYKGKRVQLKGTTFLASPNNYRLRMQISVDGQPFANYGTLWWTREGTSR
jgi:hypothetical protein